MTAILRLIFPVVITIIACLMVATMPVHGDGPYFEVHQKALSDLMAQDEELAVFVRHRRINRSRDHQVDLPLARLLQDNNFSKTVVLPLAQELLETWTFKANLELLEGAVAASTTNQPAGKRIYLAYNATLNHPFFYFTDEEKAKAEAYIESSSIANAWSFTTLPQTIYTDALIEKMDIPELESVMAHELSHAQSNHSFHILVTYAILLTAGYDMFHDSDGFDMQIDSQFNPLIQAVKSKIGLMIKHPDEVRASQELSPFEKAIPLTLSQFAGSPLDENYAENMRIYLNSITDLATKISVKATQTGQRDDLQQLVYQLESIFIDYEALERDTQLTRARLLRQNVLMSPIRESIIDLVTYLKAISRGAFAMSRSMERTADTGSVVVKGAEVEQLSMAKLAAGRFADVEQQMAQLERAQQLRESNPERTLFLDNYRSHPMPNERLKSAQEMEQSFRFQVLTDPFLKMLGDTIDVAIFQSRVSDILDGISNEDQTQIQTRKAMKERLFKHLDYVQGRSTERPEDFVTIVGSQGEIFDFKKHFGEYGEAVARHIEKNIAILDLQDSYEGDMEGIELASLKQRASRIKLLKDKLVRNVIDQLVEDLKEGNIQTLYNAIYLVNHKMADNKFLNIEFGIHRLGLVSKITQRLKKEFNLPVGAVGLIRNAFHATVKEVTEILEIDERADIEVQRNVIRIKDVATRRKISEQELLNLAGAQDIETLAADITFGRTSARAYLILQNETFRERDGQDLQEHAQENGYNNPEELIDAVLANKANQPFLGITPMRMTPQEVDAILSSHGADLNLPAVALFQNCTDIVRKGKK